MDWNALIWTVVWVVGGLIALGLVAWIIIASVVAKNFNRVSKSVASGFKRF